MNPNMLSISKLFLICVCVHLTISVKFPPNIKRCSKNDPKFSQCLTNEIQRVIKLLTVPNKELGLVSLEPLEIPSLVIGAGSGAVLLAQNYEHVKIHNYSKAIINFNLDFDKKKAYLEAYFEDMMWVGRYNVSGKILLLPVFGNGPCEVHLYKCKASETFVFKEYVKNGKTHWSALKEKITLTPERVHYKFDNLFNGDKALGDNINTVLNDNWKEVFEDVGQGYADAVGEINAQLFSNVLSKYSIDELFN